jgi:CubicO group peptidase (beta-lactamase class C family)
MRRLLALALLVACTPGNVAPIDAATDAVAIDAAATTDAPRPHDAGRDAGPIPADLDGFIQYQMSVGHLPGLAAAIIQHGAVQRVITHGMATDTTQVDAHTLFLIASISKTFVAALVLGLVESGHVDLDTPAETYLGYPVRAPQDPSHAITVRELMTHTSGMTDDWFALGQATFTGDPTMTLEQFSMSYVGDPTHFDSVPETQREYCNAGFGVLGAIVEQASGQDLRMLTLTTLTTPLALDGAGWWLTDVDTSRLAVEYTTGQTDASGHTSYVANPQRGFGHYTATSMRISVTGLSRWLLAHIQNGMLDGATFLSQASIDEERRVQFPAIDAGQGLVWYYRGLGGSRWLSHSGSSYGASTDILYRSDGRGLVLMTNSDAYLRQRVGQNDGADALEAILARMNQEADLLP